MGDPDSLSQADELLEKLHNFEQDSLETQLEAAYDLFVTLKPNIIDISPDSRPVVPINLLALHNEDFDSVRVDADADLYIEVGKEKHGVEILCKFLKWTLDPERLESHRLLMDQLQTNIAACLMILSRSMFKDGSKQLIHDHGGIPPLCEIVGLRTASRTTLFWVTACIRNVSRRFDSKAEIVEYEFLLKNLLRLLKGYGKAVKAGACSAICNLSWGELRNQVTVEGAIPMLVTALYSKCEHVVRSAAGALRNLSCSDPIREQIVQQGAIPKLVALLNSDSQQILYWKNLAIGSSFVGPMIDNGAVENVVGAVERATKPKTFERLCGILRHLSSEENFLSRFRVPVGKRFFSAVLSHASDKGWEDALEAAVLFIYHAASTSTQTLEMLHEIGALHNLLDLLLQVPWPLKNPVSTIVSLFINDRGTLPIDIKPFVREIAPELMKNLVSTDQDVKTAVFIVRNLTVEETFSEELVQVGVLPPLIELLRSDVVTVSTMAIRALTNIAAHPVTHPIIVKSGALAPLRQMLALKKGPRQNAIRLLWNLCCGGQLNEVLIDNGFIPPIVALLDDKAWQNRNRGEDDDDDDGYDSEDDYDMSPVFGQAQTTCVMMLGNLASSQKGQHALLDAGALPLLARACASRRSSLRSTAYGLLMPLLQSAKLELLSHDFIFDLQLLKLQALSTTQQPASSAMDTVSSDDSDSSIGSDDEDGLNVSRASKSPQITLVQQTVVNRLLDLMESQHPKVDDTDLNFGFLMDSEQYSDMQIVVNGVVRIHAHRAVVHGRSRYFRAMFESGLAEWKGSEIHVNVPCDPSFFREIVRYIYCEQASVSEDNVQALMELSDQYLLPGLTSKCEEFLIQHLSIENFEDIAQLGQLFRSTRVAIAVGIYFSQNAEEILSSVKLDQDAIKALLQFDLRC